MAKAVIKGGLNYLAVGMPVGDWVVDAWSEWNQQASSEAQKTAEVQEIVAAGPEETRRQAEEAVHIFAGHLPLELQGTLKRYLTQIPAGIQRSLKTSADPTGTTIPPGRTFRGTPDIELILPPRMPRFQAGDKPAGIGDWELVGLLGTGGFGEVWKARNPFFGGVPPVALKFCLDPDASRALRHEAAILNQVMLQGKHEGIVQLQHSYLNANPPCLEYEFVAGGDLAGIIRDWHRSGTGCSPDNVAQLMLQLAEIVGFAHRLNPPIVHRDLKPANILTQNKDGRIVLKVTDFGIGGVAMSQAIAESRSEYTRALMAATVARGAYTPHYASPQQMAGKPADPRDNVYSLGVIWYQMLTGELTEGAPTGLVWADDLAKRGVSRPMIQLLAGCLASRTEDRPKDAADLADRIHAITGPHFADLLEGLPPLQRKKLKALNPDGPSGGVVKVTPSLAKLYGHKLAAVVPGAKVQEVSVKELKAAMKVAGTAVGKEDLGEAEHTPETASDDEQDRTERVLRKRFWEGLLSRPNVKTIRPANITPGGYPGLGVSSGYRGLAFNYVIRPEDEGRVELYIDRGAGRGIENKEIFDTIHRHREEIEKTFGGELSWQRLNDKQACRIAYITRVGGYRSDESKWPEIQDAMIDAMSRLEKALTPHLEKLKTELASDGVRDGGADADG